jgi:hypothetical protein
MLAGSVRIGLRGAPVAVASPLPVINVPHDRHAWARNAHKGLLILLVLSAAQPLISIPGAVKAC